MIKFKIWGVLIKISILFPAMFLLLAATDTTGVTVMCLYASIFHELGHLIMLALVGGKPSKIEFSFFGMVINQNPAFPLSYNKARLVSLAGPFVNLVIAGLFIIILLITGTSTAESSLLKIITVNLSIGCFNLLPIEPLDGGQFLYYSLLNKKTTETADKVILVISLFTLIPIATAGFYLLIQSGYNLSLILVSVYLALLIILKRRGLLSKS